MRSIEKRHFFAAILILGFISQQAFAEKKNAKASAAKSRTAPASKGAQGGLRGNANAGSSSDVFVSFKFQTKNLSQNIRIYDLPDSKFLDAGQTTSQPLGNPISYRDISNGFYMKKSDIKTFAMVFENSTNQPVYFYASPHSVSPEENGLGLRFKCLCNNHIFKVMPNTRWMRVGSLTLAKDNIGDRVYVTHHLIGMSEAEIVQKKAQEVISVPEVH